MQTISSLSSVRSSLIRVVDFDGTKKNTRSMYLLFHYFFVVVVVDFLLTDESNSASKVNKQKLATDRMLFPELRAFLI